MVLLDNLKCDLIVLLMKLTYLVESVQIIRGCRFSLSCIYPSQETPGATRKFGLGIQNEAGQRLIEFCHEKPLVTANTLFQQATQDSTHGHHQVFNTEIRLIIFFAVKDGEALDSQQK